jgi:hypothetical protein
MAGIAGASLVISSNQFVPRKYDQRDRFHCRSSWFILEVGVLGAYLEEPCLFSMVNASATLDPGAQDSHSLRILRS